MRKISIAVLSLLLASVAFAQEAKLSVGAGVGFEGQNQTTTVNTTTLFLPDQSTTSFDKSLINFGVFIDATYLVVGVKYAMQFNNTKIAYNRTQPISTGSNTESNDQTGNLELSIAGKLPFKITDGFFIFPLLGVEYDINLTQNGKDSLNSEQKGDLNDLYLIAGLGADIYATSSVYFRPQVNFGLDLTSAPTTVPSGSTYLGYKVDVGVAIGFTY